MKRLPFFLLLLIVPAIVTSAKADTQSLITQSSSTDCGPAALATLLNYYLEVPTTEKEIKNLSQYNPKAGTTLNGLRKAAENKGCAAGSFLMNYLTLKEQLDTFASPVIVRTLNPEPHFSVLLALDSKHVYLADPSIGNIMLSRKVFWKRWYLPDSAEGYVFVVNSPGHQVDKNRVNQTIKSLHQGSHNLEIANEWISTTH